MGEIHGTGHGRKLGRCVPSDIAGIADDGLPVGSALGRDQDDTVGGPGSVDGGGGGVLEDGNALDIIGVDILEAHLDAIHEDIGIAGIAQVAASTEGDGRRGARGAGRRVGDGQAGNHALKGLGGIHDGTLGEVISLDLGDGAGQVDFLLDAVTDDDRFFQHLRIVLQDHVQGSAVPGDLLGDIADAGEDEDVAGPDTVQDIGAVDVGDRAGLCALDEHRAADDGFTGWIGNRSPDGLWALCQHDDGSHECGCRRQDGFAECFKHSGFFSYG